MYNILEKRKLNSQTYYMRVEAPLIARKAQSGQFIILRTNSKGERIPLTIADFDRAEGWVAIIFQAVGKTTMELSELEAGQSLTDFTGPLGLPTELEGYKKAAVVGGGVGCAIAYPQAKHLKELGAHVDMIAGFRNSDMIILEEEMKQVCDSLTLLTDDGSNGNKGLVTDGLKKLIEGGAQYDLVVAIGPPIMMKFVSALTKQYGIKTLVSLNPIMIDGTGMCGGCRVTVGGKTKFACVDGPDFDGHEVDFDELMARLKIYKGKEQKDIEKHTCRLDSIK